MKPDDPLSELKKQAERLNEAIKRIGGESQSVTFKDFAMQYLTAKLDRPTLRQSTKDSFSAQVKNHLIPAFGDAPIDKITNADWLRWVMKIKNMKSPTITRFFNTRKALAEILIAAKEDRHIDRAPKLDNPDEPKDVGRALSDWEVFRLLKSCKNSYFRFFFYVLFKMGCRPREVLKWEWEMITWGEPGHSWIAIPARISKTNRSRKIPINGIVSKRLYRLRGNGSRYCFPRIGDPSRNQNSYHGAWRSARELAGVNAVPYDFRRTFITRCAAENKPLIYVARCLDTSTKMIESVYSKAQEEVMEAIVR